VNRGRYHSLILATAIAVSIEACAVGASSTEPTPVPPVNAERGNGLAADHAGEAPEPERQGPEIVEPDNRPIDEADQNYWAIVDRALAIEEPDPATSILAEIEAALGLGELRLIGTEIEDMTDGQWGEELNYLLEDGSTLRIWWQTLHPNWDRTPLTEDDLLAGWPPGVDAALDNRSSGHIQVVFQSSNILGLVVVSKPPIAGAGVPDEYDATRIESLARTMYNVLAGT